jgi:hypothetical protein
VEPPPAPSASAAPPASPPAGGQEPGPRPPLYGPSAVLRKVRKSAKQAAPWSGAGRKPWIVAGLVLLGTTIVVPFVAPKWAAANERLATLASLTFLLAVPGLVMKMGRRAILVAAAIVVVLYGLSAYGGLALHLRWGGIDLQVQDLFLVAILASFGIFLLAGLNLVLILEEVVYDIHRVLIHPRNRAWLAAPTLLCLALAVGLPRWEARGGPHLQLLWLSAVVWAVLLALWWLVRLASRLRGGDAIVRELHLLAFCVLGTAGIADGFGYLEQAETLVPSLVAYLVLVGTWVYTNYTTLQRAHFILRGRDSGPWIALLLSASFAIIAHANALYRLEGSAATADLLRQRVGYLLFGLAAGVAFLLARGLWRGFQELTGDTRLSAGSRRAAAQAGRVAGSILATEERVERATATVYRTLDRILPGTSRPPERQPHEPLLDSEGLGPKS